MLPHPVPTAVFKEGLSIAHASDCKDFDELIQHILEKLLYSPVGDVARDFAETGYRYLVHVERFN